MPKYYSRIGSWKCDPVTHNGVTPRHTCTPGPVSVAPEFCARAAAGRRPPWAVFFNEHVSPCSTFKCPSSFRWITPLFKSSTVRESWRVTCVLGCRPTPSRRGRAAAAATILGRHGWLCVTPSTEWISDPRDPACQPPIERDTNTCLSFVSVPNKETCMNISQGYVCKYNQRKRSTNKLFP